MKNENDKVAVGDKKKEHEGNTGNDKGNKKEKVVSEEREKGRKRGKQRMKKGIRKGNGSSGRSRKKKDNEENR